MLTPAEATQQGHKFAEKWDAEKHTVTHEGMKTFAQELNALNTLSAPQKNALKWAELRGATDGLIEKKVLPNLDVVNDKSGLRNCRVVGLTADGDKNDLVVAIGRRKDNTDKAENVVILGHDGKFYQARQVKGGYVRGEDVIAQNADELERKYNRPGFTAKTEHEKTKEKPSGTTEPVSDAGKKRGNPADLEEFRKDLKLFQRQAPNSEDIAKQELNRLAEEYGRLSREQQSMAFSELPGRNSDLNRDVWICGLRASKPQVAIQRGDDGTIRFSANWSDGTSLFHRPGTHQVFSQKFNLETR